MQNLFDIQAAILQYRKINPKAGSRIEAGKVQLVQITYDKATKKSTVVELSPWMPIGEFAEYVKALTK